MAYSLVTGGAGFIGSHVAQHCLNMGQKVIVLDNLSGGRCENVPVEAKFIVGSVTDEAAIKDIFDQYEIEYVYHLAAYAAEGLSHFIRRFNYVNNVLGSVNLINAAVNHNIKAFVFTSSIAVYGKNQLPMHEDLVPRPEDPYGIAKYAVELDLEAAHRMFGLNYVIFRPHNCAGIRQSLADPFRNVIGIFMNQIMAGKPMTIFGDGQQTRAFSDIDDVAPHIARCVTVPKARQQVFNLGANTPYTINVLAELVAEAFGVKPDIQYLPARNEVEHVYADHAKAAHILDAVVTVSLRESIQRMAEWAKTVGIQKSEPFDGIEIVRNLPPSWEALTV